MHFSIATENTGIIHQTRTLSKNIQYPTFGIKHHQHIDAVVALAIGINILLLWCYNPYVCVINDTNNNPLEIFVGKGLSDNSADGCLQ